MKPLVSIIITTRNEEQVISSLLNSLKKQTYKKKEIIVVDNNSIDKTKKIAESHKTKVFNYGPERSSQRNYGAKKSKGQYLLFLDADMRLVPNVIEECVRVISKLKKPGGVVIPEKSIASNLWEKAKAFERSFYNQSGDSVTEAARFFPKKVFLKVGGYDESITGAEDWDLPETVQEYGYEISRINSLIYHKERITSVLSVAKKKYYYGLKAHKYLDKHHIPILGPKTVYFLRPTFYKQWKKLTKAPVLTLAMVVMLLFELIGGGLGYLVGRVSK